MKIIHDQNNLSSIILEDGDKLEVTSLNNHNEKIVIECFQSTLHIDEVPIVQIKNKRKENIAIHAMIEYLKKEENKK